MSQPTDRPAPCRHQYWDLGRCIDCFKTSQQVDDERRAADPTNDPRNWGTPEELSGMEERRRAPAQPETSAPPATCGSAKHGRDFRKPPAWCELPEGHLGDHQFPSTPPAPEWSEQHRLVLEDAVNRSGMPKLVQACAAALQHIEGLTRQLRTTEADAADSAKEIVALMRDRAGRYTELQYQHAKKQAHADGFQTGWHAALKRIQAGDKRGELVALVPLPAPPAAPTEEPRR